jgi:hypothetical protein
MEMRLNEKQRMSRRALAMACALLLLATTPGFASGQAPRDSTSDSSSSAGSSSDRDATAADLKGITRKHRYVWVIAAGSAIGAGVGLLLPPGSGKSASKGLLIGGSAASFFYLPGHKDAADGWRPLAWIATNTVLGGGIGWTICNCGLGFGVGALIGGGITALTQAIGPRHHRTISTYTGAQPQPPNPPPQPQQPPVNPPPQPQPPQSQPNPPQANPPPTTPPPDQPPDAPEPQPDR